VIAESSFVLHWLRNSGTLGFPSLPPGLHDHTPLHYVIHMWNDFAAHHESAVAGV
jgi:hypothetical protein